MEAGDRRAARAGAAWLAAWARARPRATRAVASADHEEAAIFARYRSARIEFQRPVRLVVRAAPKRAPAAEPSEACPTWHLRRGDDGWILEQEGQPEPVRILRTRRQALLEADALARKARGRLIIHQATGTIERDHRLD